ncbi:MAG TPA: STM3941 family protein [Pyrinomonadaceae bacterium]|nr:STM3941 family protein [Pyrinomonadaceae bacterium]
MDEIIIRNSKGSAVIGLAIFIPFTLIGIYLLNKETSLINWLITLMFGALSAVCLWLYFDRRPRIVINEQGITDARTKLGLVEFRDITNLSVVRSNNTQHIQLKVIEPSKYLSRMGKIQKLGSKIDKVAGLDELSINATGLEMFADQIAGIIAERVALVQNKIR